ncbi:putative UPF0674 endoplasmic reticulum membrane protein [Venustampulla echinocandica]|uniref:Putative UPF0674 endoplasmic reticulum membrane protein n=1 Tax=Venustampulla echinocandica TaxID=2656787 RepID=A0A370TPJ9_9HELO|nr:putative UPF0674 endoplasmic reticulum membrane protein [Venustampulla echinocandica]RDL37446.1 putative UPF0674 endoplasmic reticulum membrane protein [Venustampulla echinocandica]
MAALLKDLFGGSKPSASPIPVGDSDFADFAGAADPSPTPFSAIPTAPSFPGAGAVPTGAAGVPYTKWYNIHERHSLSEFKQEGLILGFLTVIAIIHLFGTRVNRSKAKSWISAHAPTLKKEFALVGFGGPQTATVDDVAREGLAKTMANESLDQPVELLKEKSPQEFATYATGRQNVAFLDINLTLLKRYSPLSMIAEFAMGLFFESMPSPAERMQAVLYPFDGREALTVPGQIPGAHELRKDTKSSYDNFVWAVVNKDTMKQLRDDRYDVSITGTKDSPKLPIWATVMSESAEITDFLLTPELIKAIQDAREYFDHLIITDQPVDQPLTLDETIPKKRLYLSLRLPSSGNYSSLLPIFEYFIRLTDTLVQSAHFRPEVLRKVRSTREDMIKKLQKADEEEKAEERAVEREKTKKLKRDLELKNLDAKAQKKYLEKEKERDMKRMQKKQSMRG